MRFIWVGDDPEGREETPEGAKDVEGDPAK